MKLKQLEIFCKIVELGSFSKAAKALRLSQPTVTEHIKSLESYLGITLLDRLGREIFPTKAGEAFCEYAGKILNLKIEAEQRLHSLRGELKGELTVGASTIPGEYILPSLIKYFRDKYPGISVAVIISDTKKVIEQVLENRTEIGIVGAKVEDAKLEYYQFVKDELILVVPAHSLWGKGKSITPDKLREIPFVLREEGSGTRMVLEKALKDHGIPRMDLKVVTTMGSTTAVIQAIKSGAGCSILSRRAVQEDLDRGSLRTVEIKGIKLMRDFYFVFRRGKIKSPLCEAFLNFLLDSLRKETPSS